LIIRRCSIRFEYSFHGLYLSTWYINIMRCTHAHRAYCFSVLFRALRYLAFLIIPKYISLDYIQNTLPCFLISASPDLVPRIATGIPLHVYAALLFSHLHANFQVNMKYTIKIFSYLFSIPFFPQISKIWW
jgi:hypothetical protein